MTGQPPPTISPDGRYYWDGQAWRPLAPPPLDLNQLRSPGPSLDISQWSSPATSTAAARKGPPTAVVGCGAIILTILGFLGFVVLANPNAAHPAGTTLPPIASPTPTKAAQLRAFMPVYCQDRSEWDAGARDVAAATGDADARARLKRWADRIEVADQVMAADPASVGEGTGTIVSADADMIAAARKVAATGRQSDLEDLQSTKNIATSARSGFEYALGLQLGFAGVPDPCP